MQTAKLIDFCSWALLGVSILLLSFASRYIENILFGKQFVGEFFLLGLAISISLTVLLYKTKRDYFEGGEERASAVLSLFFSSIILTIFLSAYYNYYSGKDNIYFKEAILTEKTTNVKTRTEYFTLQLDGRNERFNPKHQEFKSLNKGDTVMLTMGKGMAGYDFIYQFRKKSKSEPKVLQKDF